MSSQIISTLDSKAEFNEIYNHYHAGNYQGTIQLVERYAPRESSSEMIRAIYQAYRLFSLYALSQFGKLSEESNRLLEMSSDPQLKTLFGYFKRLSNPDDTSANSPKIANLAPAGNEGHILRHFSELIYCALLIKKGNICQVIDLLSECDFLSSAPHFHLERFASHR